MDRGAAPFSGEPEPVEEESGRVLAEASEEPPSKLSPRWPTEVRQWEELITASAQNHGLDPDLYAALIKKESWFPVDTWPQGFERCPAGPVTPSCTSVSGALGIAQVMPFHFTPDENGRDPQTNIFRGAEIFAEYLAIKGGDIRTGLAAYHGGPYRDPLRQIDWAYADLILEWYQEATQP